MSLVTVQRIWFGRGLNLVWVKTFKIHYDRRFEEKLIDVVASTWAARGSVVLCVDEKSQIQAVMPRAPIVKFLPAL